MPPTPGTTAFFGDHPGLYLTFASGQIYAVLSSAASEEVEVRAIHRLRELVREICRTHEIEILEGSVSREHVHVLLSCPPNLSPSKIMQYIKGKSSRKLLMEFKHLQKQYWGRHLWARGYFVASSGNVTDEAIMEYIRQQEGTEPSDGGDNFQLPKS